MNYCVMCGSPVPDSQRVCSMCYGDISYGSDGYYEHWARDQEQRALEQLQAEEEQMRLEQKRRGDEKNQ